MEITRGGELRVQVREGAGGVVVLLEEGVFDYVVLWTVMLSLLSR